MGGADQANGIFEQALGRENCPDLRIGNVGGTGIEPVTLRASANGGETNPEQLELFPQVVGHFSVFSVDTHSFCVQPAGFLQDSVFGAHHKDRARKRKNSA
jgi:hypothetical protein